MENVSKMSQIIAIIMQFKVDLNIKKEAPWIQESLFFLILITLKESFSAHQG